MAQFTVVVETASGRRVFVPTTALETVGGIFVGLLKAAVPPLVFTAIVVSIANLRKVANAARLATQTLVWFMITSLIAVTIGIGLGLLTNPGSSANVTAEGATYEGTTGSWLDFLTGLVPQNFLGLTVSDSALSFSVLQIVVVALAIGAASLKAGEKAEPFLGFMTSALAVIQQVLWWITLLAPIGTLGLIGRAVATYGWGLVAPLATFTFDVYLGWALGCSWSTRCSPGSTASPRRSTSPAPGPPSSSPSCRAPRSAPCRSRSG